MKDNLTLEDRMFGRFGTLTPEEDAEITAFYSSLSNIYFQSHILTVEEAMIECAFCRKIGGYRCLTEAAAKVCPNAPAPIYPERRSMRGRDDYAL